MSNSVGQIDLDLALNSMPFQRQMASISGMASGALASAFTGLGGIIAGAFSIYAISEFARQSIQLASDLQEVQNVVDVTFGSMSNHVNEFAASALASFGMSELSAKRFTGTMGAMLKSSGLTGDAVVKLSEDMTGLAGDFASFYNLSQDDAFTKIRAGISGETEPLKQLGINMSVANLEAYALSKGITKQFQSMTQAEQVMLRYNYLMSVSSDAQGDFARTSGSWANQTRLLSEQWKIFSGTMGAGFISLLTPVLHMLNELIAKLQLGAQYFKAFAELVTGVNVGDLSTESTSAADAISGIGDRAAGSSKDVKKAAKEMKGALAGFDQLTILDTSTSASASSTAAPDAVTMPTVELPKVDTSGVDKALEPIKKSIEAFLAPLKSMDFTTLTSSLNVLKDALAPIGAFLFDGLKWGYENVLLPLSTFVIEDALPAFLNALAGAFTFLSPVLESFKPLFDWLWTSMLQPVASWTGGTIVSVLNGIGEALSTLGTWMSDNQSVVDGMTTSVVTFFAAWKVMQLMAFIQMSGGVIAVLISMTTALWTNTTAKIANAAETIALTALYAKDFIVSIAKSIAQLALQTGAWIANTAAMAAGKAMMISTAICQGIMTIAMGAWSVASAIGTAATWAFNAALAVLTSPITLVVLAIAAVIAAVIALIYYWGDVKKYAGIAWDWIVNVWKVASTWFMNTVINPIVNSFKWYYNTVIGIFSSLWNGIKSIWRFVSGWYKTTVITPIVSFFSNLWTNIKNGASDAWDGMKRVFSKAFNWFRDTVVKPITNSFIGLFNALINGLNSMIKAMNKIKFEAPDWVPVIGGKSFGIDIPLIKNIPALAKGGLVSAPTLAMVGDNKRANVDPEVIAPLSKLQSMLENKSQPVQVVQHTGDIVLQVGDNQLIRITREQINRAQRMSGKPAFVT